MNCMSTLPSASLIRSTTFNNDLINIFSVSEVYTATVSFTGTGKDYTGTVSLSPGYNTTIYKVFSSVVSATPLQNNDSEQYLHPVIITSRTATSFDYSIYVGSGFGSSAQSITIDFSVRYYLPQVLTTFGPIFTLYTTQATAPKQYAIIVTWTNSIDTGASISSYTIDITNNTGYHQTYLYISNTSTSYIIDGLNEFTSYTISITAINRVGSNRPVRTNYTIGNNFNFNYKTTNTAITKTDVLNHLPFITTDNKLTINPANVYVNIQTDVDPNNKLVSVEIPPEAFTFTDNTTTHDGLSFQSSDYYFFGSIIEINILFFGNNGTQTKIIPLSRGGTQFGLSNSAYSAPESTVILTISNSDKPHILTTTSFAYTLRKLTNFNSDISGWSVSNVTNMGQMFLRTRTFNRDIHSWDVSNVTDMSYMFNEASAFNNGDTGNNQLHPLNWTTSALTSAAGMFGGASAFNQEIFVLTKVTGTLEFMFYNAPIFNQDISRWDVSKVTYMNQVFYNAYAFNQDISSWDVSKVRRMDSMFYNATNFNNGGGVGDTTHPMTGWNVIAVTNHTNFGTGSGLYYTTKKTGNIQPNYWEYVPSNPTGVLATYHSGDYNNYSVDISWNAVYGATSYNVKLTTNTTDTITSVLSTLNSYTFTGLNVSNTYIFSVQAVNSQGGSSAYSSASISSANVGTSTLVWGIDSSSYINYADITLTGASGAFYKFNTSPNTSVSTISLADVWTNSPTNVQIHDLITNFNYTFTITAYNIAGNSSSTTIPNSKPVNNFIFSYITTQLPHSGTSGGDVTQQQREGIYNYLPFYYGTNVATTGTLTLSSLLYTTSNYITWTSNSPYTVTISFPQFHTDGTPLWTYTHPTGTPSPLRAGIAISADIEARYTTIANYYAAYDSANPNGGSVSSLTYNNFGSIPISGGVALWYSFYYYTNIFIITNNSIPIFPANTITGNIATSGYSIGVFARLRPSNGSSINLSNWDVSNVTTLNFLFNNCEFNLFGSGAGVEIDISNWNVRNITNMNRAIWNIRLGNMKDLNWNLQSIQSMFDMFGVSNFNSNLNFIFPQSTSVNLSSMFENAGSFNKNISTRTVGTTSYWNVSKVTNISNMFKNATSFNNGGAGGDTTHPLNWEFTDTPTSTNWHLNAPLTPENGLTNPPLY